ncbi:hypothetical protein [Acinetobacter kanungonis]|uniref:hypothetical protein n=1 Tax=Acinetobacter kanungonis TaxID=2699469 RepID=UPI0013798B7D|nr:hypothetical protein [Acinetobacter kanungonis]NCI78554.1 hypothetical protein [Acinetobacter kanungonis]
MPEIIDQDRITALNSITWAKSFEENDFLYLKHVINGLIDSSSNDSISVQVDRNKKIIHIFEPFAALNDLGYGSPSVVSIDVATEGKVKFLGGDDNGIEINSTRLFDITIVNKPQNLTADICFWHFVDAIGCACTELCES